MGFDIGAAVNSLSDWLCGSALVKGIVSNPIFTALLLTATVVIILLSMYYKEFKIGGKKKLVRIALFLFAAICVVIFIHHRCIERSIQSVTAQKGVRDVFEGIAQSRQMNPTVVSVQGAGEREAASASGSAEDEESEEEESKTPVAVPPAIASTKPPAAPGELQIEDVVIE